MDPELRRLLAKELAERESNMAAELKAPFYA